MLTKSECINALKEIALSYDAEYVNECNDEFCQAMKKKIKLLEDLIDEHFPKTLSDEMFEKLGYTKMESYDKCSESYCLVQNVDEYEHLEEHFDNRPSKVGKWIPCSERLPEKVDSYLVTMKNVGEYRWIGISMYFGDGKWAYDDDEKEVIAWMPKPELWDGDLE